MRTTAVELTEAGHGLIEGSVDELLRHEQTLVGHLTPAQREQLTELLRTLLDGLTRRLGDSNPPRRCRGRRTRARRTGMTRETERFSVINGGPGAGTSTQIDRLRRTGHACADESGRAIIRHQTPMGGTALPWSDPGLYAELMLSWDMRSHEFASPGTGPVFFDHTVARIFRYHPRVFAAPPWPEPSRTGSASSSTRSPSRLRRRGPRTRGAAPR